MTTFQQKVIKATKEKKSLREKKPAKLEKSIPAQESQGTFLLKIYQMFL